MVWCKDCIHCIKMELESWQEENGAVFSEWMCFCSLDQTWESENDEQPCANYFEDKTRA